MGRTATHLAPALGGFLLAQRHRAACTEETAALFFDDGRRTGRSVKARQEATAKAICRLCPILGTCRAYARADSSLEGIWGGETQDERHAARRNATGAGLLTGDNEQGRRLATLAARLAHRDGLDAAATALKVPPATLQRVFDLYGLEQPSSPASPPRQSSCAPERG
jgi:WhiB family redox-sensing transcriptional regulator